MLIKHPIQRSTREIGPAHNLHIHLSVSCKEGDIYWDFVFAVRDSLQSAYCFSRSFKTLMKRTEIRKRENAFQATLRLDSMTGEL